MGRAEIRLKELNDQKYYDRWYPLYHKKYSLSTLNAIGVRRDEVSPTGHVRITLKKNTGESTLVPSSAEKSNSVSPRSSPVPGSRSASPGSDSPMVDPSSPTTTATTASSINDNSAPELKIAIEDRAIESNQNTSSVSSSLIIAESKEEIVTEEVITEEIIEEKEITKETKYSFDNLSFSLLFLFLFSSSLLSSLSF